MSSTPIDFKEQMAETRRVQILMGAAEVFAEKGFHKATTRAIAKRAGISEGTIYNYFDNKRELLLALIDLLAIQSLKHIVDGDSLEDPDKLLTDLAHNRYQLAEERGYLLIPIIAEIFSDAELRELLYQKILIPITGQLEKYFQAQIDTRRFRQVDPTIATRAYVGILLVNFALKLSHLDTRYEDISAEALIEQIVSLMLHGLLMDKSKEA